MKSPILLLVFNRPKQTAKVFEAIRAIKPMRFYVAADGPRTDREGEVDLCQEVRHIATQVDWPCTVKTLFRDKNLGCMLGVSGGINWFFNNEDQGIILEDDCLPHPDFFEFCDVLLDRYAADERVWAITGNNFQQGRQRGDASYYFSRYHHVWGWASWSSAWKDYQVGLQFWPEWRASQEWQKMLPDHVEQRYWFQVFNRVFRGEIDTWDYQWQACIWRHGGLTATPNVNLVTNIGYGEDATHTQAFSDRHVVEAVPLGRFTHPTEVIRDAEADRIAFDNYFGGRSLRWPMRGLYLGKAAMSRLFRWL